MTSRPSIAQDQSTHDPERCIHCTKGLIFEPTDDLLEDEVSFCHMCLGTGRKKSRAERIAARADLDAHHSGLERMEG